MKYWKVSLLHEGRTAREWHVRAEVLTVGSHGSNKVRLPPPVEPFALQFSELSESATLEVGPYTLVVEDETHQRNALWSDARSRVQEAVSAASVAPRETPVPVRAAIAACTLLGLTNLVASLVVEDRRDAFQTNERSKTEMVARLSANAPLQAPAPRFENVNDAATPARVAVDVAAPSRNAGLLFASSVAKRQGDRSIVAITRNVQIPAAPVSHSWDGAMLASASGELDLNTMPGEWLASVPQRYRAPWPDAPIPPH